MIYDKFLNKDKVKPTIERKYPLLDWKRIWQNLHCHTLDIRQKELSWKIAHNILFTNLKLANWGYMRASATCPRRSCNIPESVPHLFFKCHFVQLIWMWVDNLLAKIDNNFKCTTNLVLYNLVDFPLASADIPLVLFIVNSVKILIWFSRCEAEYEKRYDPPDILLGRIKMNIRSRLAADLLRLPRERFIKQWCRHDILARKQNNNVVIVV